jgi:hypothetical protein
MSVNRPDRSAKPKDEALAAVAKEADEEKPTD